MDFIIYKLNRGRLLRIDDTSRFKVYHHELGFIDSAELNGFPDKALPYFFYSEPVPSSLDELLDLAQSIAKDEKERILSIFYYDFYNICVIVSNDIIRVV